MDLEASLIRNFANISHLLIPAYVVRADVMYYPIQISAVHERYIRSLADKDDRSAVAILNELIGRDRDTVPGWQRKAPPTGPDLVFAIWRANQNGFESVETYLEDLIETHITWQGQQ